MKNFVNTIIAYSLIIVTLIGGVFTCCYYHYAFPLRYASQFNSACIMYGVDREIAYAIAWTESKMNSRAVSVKGACGVMQLMPKTAQWCCSVLDIKYDREMLFDAEYNINLGVFYYSYLYKKFKTHEKALSAYNAGEGNVVKWSEQKPFTIKFSETRKYVCVVERVGKIYAQKLKMH